MEWVGEVEDPAPFLRELDLFALVAEPAGCPNASLEAMSAGLPVVATDAGGIAEQVVDGLTATWSAATTPRPWHAPCNTISVQGPRTPLSQGAVP